MSTNINDAVPEEIRGVSNSQFSIARYYGGVRAFGHMYVYNPVDDTLIRADVLKRRQDERRAADLAKKKTEAERQINLFQTKTE